jgi:hypothetical protein
MHWNHKKHVSKYRQRKASDGYRRLPDYWIPNTPEALAQIKELAERLCDEYERDK